MELIDEYMQLKFGMHIWSVAGHFISQPCYMKLYIEAMACIGITKVEKIETFLIWNIDTNSFGLEVFKDKFHFRAW